MIINNKTSFPYPVLGHRRGINSMATSKQEGGRSGDDYVWSFTIDHDNPDIAGLVQSGSARYICEVDCSSTNFRRCFYSAAGADAKTITARVPIRDVGGRVRIAVTAVAVKRISGYHNSRSTSFYQDYSFDLEPGDILAVFGLWDIDLDMSAESFKKITSIVQIQLTDGEEMEVLLDNRNSIIIELPKAQFDQHVGKLKNPYYRPALLSSLIYEAFVYAIQQYNDNDDKTWARIIEIKARRDLGYDNLGDAIKDDPSLAFEISRKILDNPHYHLYNLLDELDATQTDDDN